MKYKHDIRIFFQYVIPSVLSFALSGVYAIVDGFFVGNSMGDIGVSAINIAYPLVAVIQSLGTGIGMGGAIYYSNQQSRKKGGTSKSVYCGSCVAVNCHKCFCNNHIFLFEQFPFKAVRSRKSASFFGRGLYFYYCVRRRFTDYRNWFSSVHP